MFARASTSGQLSTSLAHESPKTTSRTASERVADVGVAAAKEREATRAPGVLAPLVDRVWAASDQFVGGGRRVSADEVVEVVQVTQGALGLFARTKPGQATPIRLAIEPGTKTSLKLFKHSLFGENATKLYRTE